MKVVGRFTNAANQPWFNTFWVGLYSLPLHISLILHLKRFWSIPLHGNSWLFWICISGGNQLVILIFIASLKFAEPYIEESTTTEKENTRNRALTYSPFPHFREGTSGARDESKLCKISWLVHWNANWILQTLPNDQSCALICTVYFPNCVA